MKMRLALLIVAVALVAVIWAMLRFPSVKPASKPPHPKPPAASPREVVHDYLTALEQKDYAAAYALLSRESKEVHSRAEFGALADKYAAPSLDAAAGVEQAVEEGRMVVMVPMIEDPATSSFTLVKEEGEWRILFRNEDGSPWFPYP